MTNDPGNIAEKLYGADDTESATKSTHPNDEAAAVMYAPDPRREFSRGDEQTFTGRRDEQLRAGIPPDELLQYDRDFADWSGKTGLEPHITRRWYNAAVDADLAELRGVAFDEAEHQRMAEATRDEIFSTYGAEEGARWLERTNEWVKKHHPKLHELLGRRGIGSRKDIVIPILEHVRRIHLGLR